MSHLSLDDFGRFRWGRSMPRFTSPQGGTLIPESAPPILEPEPTIEPLSLASEGGPTAATKPVAPAVPPNRLLDLPLIHLTPWNKSGYGNSGWWNLLLYLSDSQFATIYPHIVSGNWRAAQDYLGSILNRELTTTTS